MTRFIQSPLDGLWEIQAASRGDLRGKFTRVFCAEEFATIRSEMRFVQVNHSVTARRGTVRGLHYQRTPHAEAKLIRCIRGAVFDVAVDLRMKSPTFGQWHAVELTEDNNRQVFIPEGFAHGFQSLTDDAELLYQHTSAYAAGSEAGVRFDDSSLGISWPLPIGIVSERDLALPLLSLPVDGIAA